MSTALVSLIALIVTSLSLICFIIIFFISRKIYELKKDHKILEIEMDKKYKHLLNNLKSIARYIEDKDVFKGNEPCVKLVKDD